MQTSVSHTPRIALIHATPLAVEPINAIFQSEWPEAIRMNVLDDSLSADLSRIGHLDAALEQRFVDLAAYAVGAGADAVIFTCSAFGPAIEKAAQHAGVPTLKPNESMFRHAIALAAAGAGRVTLMTSFAPAAAPMRAELLDDARRAGIVIQLQECCVPEAMVALNTGQFELHDQLLAEAASTVDAGDVLILGQFSMARAAASVQAVVRCPVLTSPLAALREVRMRLLGDAAAASQSNF